jgi:GTPase SAR1 family protein
MNERGSVKRKIVLAGDVAVGKTSLINKFVTGIFSMSYKATIGVDIFTKEIIFNTENVTSVFFLVLTEFYLYLI